MTERAVKTQCNGRKGSSNSYSLRFFILKYNYYEN